MDSATVVRHGFWVNMVIINCLSTKIITRTIITTLILVKVTIDCPLFRSPLQDGEQLIQLGHLCVCINTCGDHHLQQLVVVCDARVDPLRQLWVEAQERDLLHVTAGPTAISQRFRLTDLQGETRNEPHFTMRLSALLN